MCKHVPNKFNIKIIEKIVIIIILYTIGSFIKCSRCKLRSMKTRTSDLINKYTRKLTSGLKIL